MSLRASLVVAITLAIAACGSHDDATPAPTPAVTNDAGVSPRGDVGLVFHPADRADALTEIAWGDAFAARLSGLRPGEEVTLRASTILEDGAYGSEAVFIADASGVIDTGTMAPVRGDYAGVDVDGLVWSMKKSAMPAESGAARWAFVLRAITVRADTDEVLAQGSLRRTYGRPDVKRVAVGDDGLVGAFFAPSDGARHPVIVTFGGSEGGLESGEYDAEQWAAKGYAALGLAYFGAKGLPSELREIPLEYFERAFAWLDARPEVDAKKLAVRGVSRGGELALLLGATYPRIAAVVADVPSAVSWGAPTQNGKEVASWTKGGVAVPWLPYRDDVPAERVTLPDGRAAYSYTKAFAASVTSASPEVLEKATFAVENTAGPILLVGGADDGIWPSCMLAKLAMDRLVAKGHAAKFADESVCYEASGHESGLMPGLPTALGLAAQDPFSTDLIAMGGTPQGLARAQRDAHTRTQRFLAAALK